MPQGWRNRLRSVGVWVALLLACLATHMAGSKALLRDPTLRVATLGAPSTLDPHLQDDAVSHSVLFNVYEGLTAFDGEMRLQPALATSWHSPDATTWVFKLREGVRFHDGRVLAAEDVVASLERARAHPSSRTAGYLVGLTNARAQDGSTVVLLTDRPHALLAKKLPFVAIVPRGSPSRIEVPIGTGPFRIDGHEGATTSLSRFDGYWGPDPALARVELTAVEQGGLRSRRLESGEVDLALNLESQSVTRLEHQRGIRLMRRATLTTNYLSLRCDRGPFRDLRVRQAVGLALDREELVASMRRGLGHPLSQIVNRHIFGFDPGLGPTRADPAAARDLLAAAGYPDGFEVTLEHREGVAPDAVVRQLSSAGIRATAVARPWTDLMSRLAAGQIDMHLGAVLCPTGDASDVLNAGLHSRGREAGFGVNNHWGYVNPQLDLLIQQSTSSFSESERKILLQKAVRLAARDHVMVPLFAPLNVSGAREAVVWRPRLDGFFRASEVGLSR